MLFRRLKLRALLSFGPKGVDLPMEPLTVAIGPNGSGKSNLLDAISLFQAAPRGMGEPVQRSGGMREWLWKGRGAEGAATLDATVDIPPIGSLRHSLTLIDAGGRLNLASERIERMDARNDGRATLSYHRPPADPDIAREMAGANAPADAEDTARKPAPGEWSAPRIAVQHSGDAIHFAPNFFPQDSLLRRMAASDHPALMHLSNRYERIRLYRDWSFGPGSGLRRARRMPGRAPGPPRTISFCRSPAPGIAAAFRSAPHESSSPHVRPCFARDRLRGAAGTRPRRSTQSLPEPRALFVTSLSPIRLARGGPG